MLRIIAARSVFHFSVFHFSAFIFGKCVLQYVPLYSDGCGAYQRRRRTELRRRRRDTRSGSPCNRHGGGLGIGFFRPCTSSAAESPSTSCCCCCRSWPPCSCCLRARGPGSRQPFTHSWSTCAPEDRLQVDAWAILLILRLYECVRVVSAAAVATNNPVVAIDHQPTDRQTSATQAGAPGTQFRSCVVERSLWL